MDDQEYTMSANHERVLRQISDTHLPEQLSDKLVRKYWEYKRCCDRGGINVHDSDLARLCAECGFGKKTEAEERPPTIADLYRRKEVKAGDPVEVLWRKQKRTGIFKGLNATNQPIVLLEGDSEDREVNVDTVTALQVA